MCNRRNMSLARLLAEEHFNTAKRLINSDRFNQNESDFWIGLKYYTNKIKWTDNIELNNHTSIILTGKNVSELIKELQANGHSCFYIEQYSKYLRHGMCIFAIVGEHYPLCQGYATSKS